ncbi:hypothetical protein NHX12_018503, partial [Muraenolepis orangiensis]
MVNTMVSVCSSELGPVAWDAVTKRQLFLQKVSSKLGPGAKQQTSGRAPGASSTTGPGVVLGSSAPGQGGSGSRLVHAESSSLGKEAASGGGGSQARARLSHNQSKTEEKPSRGAPSVGNQSLDKPLGPSTAAASSTIANTRAPGTRSRALSLQSRPTTIGLKPPTITGPSPSRPTNYALNHKTPASANQAPATKPSQNPLQRSGSARINRPTAT